MKFEKAVRRKAKARIALAGPSGSGKTFSAMLLAAGLGGRVAVIDTEKGSASLYAGLPGMPEFDVLELEAPYTPERYIEAMRAAVGYDIVIVDGITPEWSGVGGCLEINDNLAASKFRGNTWSAWNETTPRHRRFIDAMLTFPGHLIATMRSKTETAQEEKNGRKTVVKLGMKNEQRDGVEYEFTAVLDIVHGGHFALASKDRTRLWSDADPAAITVEDGKRLAAWLDAGADAPAQEDKAPAILAALREAALCGMAALRKAYDVQAAQDADALGAVWAANQRSLKTAAKDADATAEKKAEAESMDGPQGQNYEEGVPA